MGKLIAKFDGLLENFSRIGLIVALMLTLGLAVLSIVLRWLGSSFMWMEPLIRHLVFLSAFLGGSLATSKGVHIKVDLLTHMIEKSKSKFLYWFHRNLISLFCFVTCLALAKAGWDFFLVEKEFGAPSFLDIPSAYLVFIIPFGMGLIAVRFLNRILMSIFHGAKIEHHSL